MERGHGARKRRALEIPSSSTSNLDSSFTSARPSFSVSSDPRFAAFLAPKTTTAPSQSFQVYKPYSSVAKVAISTPGQSFIQIILSTCRPYHRRVPLVVHEEIKVEDEPLGGLDALSRAVELATQPLSLVLDPHQPESHPFSTPLIQSQQPDPSYYHSSSESTLTIYSMSPDTRSLRLPTPPSQSPPPPSSFDAPSPTAKRKKGPARATADEAEARRLQSIMTEEELDDFRKKRRRGNGYVFGVTSLRKELTRLGKTY